MAKLVVLTEGMTGRTHELNVEKTTIGRVEDNTFQIEQPSVSSHHCEILVSGSEVVVKDLNSTNGTFINGERITESVLKPGQTLRLGQIDMRLENGAPAVPAPAGAPAVAAPSAPPAKKALDQTAVASRGINLNELGQGTAGGSGFDTTSKAFSKKDNKTNNIIIIVCVVIAVAIVIGILLIAVSIKQ